MTSLCVRLVFAPRTANWAPRKVGAAADEAVHALAAALALAATAAALGAVAGLGESTSVRGNPCGVYSYLFSG